MLQYLRDRLLGSLLTLVVILTVVFLLVRLIPGDVAQVMLGGYGTPEQVATLRHEMGLDQPLYVQYAQYLVNLVQGNLGIGMRTHRPVADEIGRVLPYTIQLTAVGMLISVLLGIPLGMIGAHQRNSPIDHASMLFALFWYAVPSFWLALILLIAFSIDLPWFPTLGGGDLGDWGSLAKHMVLPALSLGLRHAGLAARMTRSCMLEELSSDYVRTARAKGLVEQVVMYKHALKNAAIPIITVIGLDVGVLLGGSVAIEIVFSRPGMGTLLVDAVLARDYSIIQGSVLVWALFVVVVNFVVDVTYSYLDPRIKNK